MEKTLKRHLPLGAVSAVALLLSIHAVRLWLDADSLLPIVQAGEGTRFRITTWAASLSIATIVAWSQDRRGNRAVGLALMTLPLWQAFFGFLDSIPDLRNDQSERSAYSVRQLSDRYIVGLVSDVGAIGTGFILWLGRLPDSFQALARHMVAHGVPRRREAQSAFHGVLMFPPLLLGSAGLNQWIRRSPALNNGNEESIWANMTPYHDLMISATAGFTEELAYRVVGIAVFAWLLGRLRMPRFMALGGAVLLQALLFAGAHGGYGTWAHVLLPLAFGLFSGIVYLWLGLWAVVVVHVLVDIFAFGGYTADRWPWFWGILVFGFYANIVASLGWSIHWAWRRIKSTAQ